MAVRKTIPRRIVLGVSTPSRHPANLDAYDARRHRYSPTYVRPRSWTLTLSALAVPPVFGGSIKEVTFDVKGVGTEFSGTLRVRSPSGGNEGDGPEPLFRGRMAVPKPGTYRVRARARGRNGPVLDEAESTFTFRDLLVVSIGDSLASGQGNPDIPAIPRPDERFLCARTTLLMIAEKVRAVVTGFIKKTDDVLAAAPLVGPPLAMAAGGAAKTAGLFTDAIATGIRVGADTVVSVVNVFGDIIGDIFGVGDGAADTPRPAKWQEPFAARSYRSGYSLAARALEEEPIGKRVNRVTFLSFARTGSEVRDGLLGPRTLEVDGRRRSIDGWIGNLGQVEEARKAVGGRRIDVLLVSIGGNDAGFSGTLTDLVINDHSWVGSGKDSATRDRVLREIDDFLDGEFSRNMDDLREAIQTRLRPRHVLIAEYPTGLFSKPGAEGAVVDGRGCEIFASDTFDLDVEKEDSRFIRAIGVKLNAKILEKAEAFRWGVIGGIDRAFEGHGYCSNLPCWVKAEQSCRQQGNFDGTMHPNARGQKRIRSAVVRAVRRKLAAVETVDDDLVVKL